MLLLQNDLKFLASTGIRVEIRLAVPNSILSVLTFFKVGHQIYPSKVKWGKRSQINVQLLISDTDFDETKMTISSAKIKGLCNEKMQSLKHRQKIKSNTDPRIESYGTHIPVDKVYKSFWPSKVSQFDIFC